jgi:transcriptional regulator with XRE-family HTH domain
MGAMSDTANNLSSVAGAIRSQRRALGLTQRDVAELCGVQRQTIGRLERADPTVSFGTAMAVADALGFRLDGASDKASD